MRLRAHLLMIALLRGQYSTVSNLALFNVARHPWGNIALPNTLSYASLIISRQDFFKLFFCVGTLAER